MKKGLLSAVFSVLVTLILLMITSVGHAQIREDLRKSSDLSGPIIKENPSKGGNLGNLFNMTMDHSYSMMFSNFGGRTSNINAYTNTMRFFFSEDLTGRVDLSVLHSPFGNNLMSPGSQPGNNQMGMDFMIRNAELNYQINDKSSISIHFQQVPGYGMNPWSQGYYNRPFNRPFQNPIYD